MAFKDKELGLVRLRAFGIFTARVTQPLLFVNTLVGTQGAYTSDQVETYLREVIVSRLNDFLGEHVETILQLPKQYDEIGVAVKTRLQDDFRRYGLELIDFFINAITPPPDVQRMIDERSGMAAVGNLDDFMKFKAAKALGDAAAGVGSAGGQAAAGGPGDGRRRRAGLHAARDALPHAAARGCGPPAHPGAGHGQLPRLPRRGSVDGTLLPRLREPDGRGQQVPSLWRERDRPSEVLPRLRREFERDVRLSPLSRDASARNEVLSELW